MIRTVDSPAIGYGCPTCGAAPGDRCRAMSGRRSLRNEVHAARVEVATLALHSAEQVLSEIEAQKNADQLKVHVRRTATTPLRPHVHLIWAWPVKSDRARVAGASPACVATLKRLSVLEVTPSKAILTPLGKQIATMLEAT